MRYMWICSKMMAPSYVKRAMEDNGSAVVQRVLRSKARACWVFITNEADFKFAQINYFNDANADHWSISSCNKQYVTNAVTGKYVGALSEVALKEADDWVFSSGDHWALRDPMTDRTWMPVQRNPNKFIPTGESTVCVHCGRTPRPQYRPWPLSKDA